MQQRDLIKDQIEQLGKALAEITNDFLKLKTSNRVPEAIQITDERFQKYLNISVEQLISVDKSQLPDYLNKNGLTAEHAERLSDYFREVGESLVEQDSRQVKRRLRSAIDLLDAADELTQTASFERMAKQAIISRILKQYE